jgi:hypothetical protein
VGQDRRRPGADNGARTTRLALHDRREADADAGHVGDRVVAPGLQDADAEAEVACAVAHYPVPFASRASSVSGSLNVFQCVAALGRR